MVETNKDKKIQEQKTNYIIFICTIDKRWKMFLKNISVAGTMIEPASTFFMFCFLLLVRLKHYLGKCWCKCWTLITWFLTSKTCQRSANNCFSLQEISAFGKLVNHNKQIQGTKYMVKNFNPREFQVPDLRGSNSQPFRIVISCMLFGSASHSIMVLCNSQSISKAKSIIESWSLTGKKFKLTCGLHPKCKKFQMPWIC